MTMEDHGRSGVSVPAGYRPTFDDEFDAFSRNTRASNSTWSQVPDGIWATHYWWGAGERTLSGNGEQQFYSDASVGVDPFSVRDGALRITAAASADPAATGGQPYTSGMITTEGVFAQTYGLFEMRAKLPPGQGLWPAFWLMAADHTWPPEIDVLETFGDRPNQLHWAAHTGPANATAGEWVNLLADTTNSFHTYGLLWTRETLTYFFDGQAIAQVATPSDMHKPMYMIANLAVGGGWGRAPADFVPATMEIDYIRAYSAAPDAVAVPLQPVSTPDVPQPTAAAAPRSPAAVRGGTPEVWLGFDDLQGGAANEQFLTGYGDLRPRAGGRGDDTYVIGDSHVPIIETPDGGIDTVKAWMDYTLPACVENMVAETDAGLHLTGNGLSNMIAGRGGQDWLNGKGGDDMLTGGGGEDVFIVRAGEGYDTVTDFETGIDRVLLDGYGFASTGDVLSALRQAGSSTVLGMDNGETLTFLERKVAGFSARDFALTNVSLGSGTTITGTAARDVVRVPPQEGLVTIDLGGGLDRVEMVGTGRHHVAVSGVEAILGSAGADLVELRGGATGTISIDLGGGSDRLVSYDSQGRSLLVSNTEATVLGSGDDTVTLRTAARGVSVDLGAGVDVLVLSDLGNTVRVSGIETIRGGAGADGITVTDGAGAMILGGAGADRLVGGSDDDVIVGGTGKDVMTGGGGADRFVFASIADSDGDTRDIVTDFQPGVDRIDIRGLGLASLSLIGELPFSRTGGAEMRFLDATDQLLLDLDGNGSIDFRMTLHGVDGTRLGIGDFVWH